MSRRTSSSLIIFVVAAATVAAVLLSAGFALADPTSSVAASRGTWSDTVKDLIAATQDDPHYRRIVLQELLSSSSQQDSGASFAETVCSHPEMLRCLGNANENKGSANSPSWPVEITIRRFNGTVHWEKLPRATTSLKIIDSPVAVGAAAESGKKRATTTTSEIDLSDLMRKLPNGLENLEFIRTRLTLSEALQSPQRNGAGHGGDAAGGDEDSDNNNNDAAAKRRRGKHGGADGGAGAVGDLQSLRSVRFVESELGAAVLEQMWLPVAALRKFEMVRCRFRSGSVAPLLLLATELEEVRVVANDAPIRFRELLVELAARPRLHTLDFQARVQSPGDGLLTDMSFPRSLTHLRLCNLSLKEVPKVLPPQLRVLSMPHNRLRGKCPDLSETVLEEMDLSNNSISEFTPARQLPASIRRVRLASNKLRGGLDLTSLPRQLVELSVAHNELSGSVDLTKLPSRLETLDIAYNRFSGGVNMREFPDSVRYVFLQNNEFTGRYDVSRLPLMSVRVLFGGNKWDSLLPKM